MNDFYPMLFNAALSSAASRQLQSELNQRIGKESMQLSAQEVVGLLKVRNQLLQEHQLIDFSTQNLIRITEKISTAAIYTKREFLDVLTDWQEIFYYLHTVKGRSADDEEILEEIWRVYQAGDGDMEFVKGYFEDEPQLDAVFSEEEWEEKLDEE